MFLDATYLKGRVAHQVVSRAVVVATGVTMDGGREVLGVAVGDSEDEAFWTAFLPVPSLPGPVGGASRHLRPPPGDQSGGERGHDRVGLAALPGPFHAQRAGPRVQGQRPHGGRRHRHHLRPARRRGGEGTVRPHHRHLRGRVPRGGGHAGRGQGGPAGFHGVSPSPTGARSGRPTPSSGSTGRSSGAATWWASSRTTPPWLAWSPP